jgi:hypothetical protein
LQWKIESLIRVSLGKFNIFVLTDDPAAAFTEARQIVLNEAITNDLRSAYRRMDAEDYVTVWPANRGQCIMKKRPGSLWSDARIGDSVSQIGETPESRLN